MSFTHPTFLLNQWSLPHVEHLGKSRYSIVHGLGHTCRFICARRKRGRNGTFRRGRRGPTKRCYSWRVGKYVGRPQRGRQRRQGSRAAAAAHNSPGDSAVQVMQREVVADRNGAIKRRHMREV